MNKIEHNGSALEVPGTWNELGITQLKYVSEKWSTWTASISVSNRVFIYFRIKMIFILCGVSRWNVFSFSHRFLVSIIPSKKQFRKIKGEEFSDRFSHLPALVQLTDFIFKDPCNLTKNKLTRVKTRLGTLHGPGDELATLVFQEFIFADTYFTKYASSKDQEDLDWLIAVLYRPAAKQLEPFSENYLGDNRQPFNLAATELMLPIVKSMKQWQKLSIFFFYMGSRNELEKDFPNVFGQPDDSSDGSAVSNWYNTLSDLPSEKFGTIRQRELYPLKTVLQELEKLIVEYSNKKE